MDVCISSHRKNLVDYEIFDVSAAITLIFSVKNYINKSNLLQFSSWKRKEKRVCHCFWWSVRTIDGNFSSTKFVFLFFVVWWMIDQSYYLTEHAFEILQQPKTECSKFHFSTKFIVKHFWLFVIKLNELLCMIEIIQLKGGGKDTMVCMTRKRVDQRKHTTSKTIVCSTKVFIL